ncbi:hypothetical protein SNEBB_002870 [Seison nebaliae]|nr:hypothetical protein SNEBB_002870 [Seison nebaliae]
MESLDETKFPPHPDENFPVYLLNCIGIGNTSRVYLCFSQIPNCQGFFACKVIPKRVLLHRYGTKEEAAQNFYNQRAWLQALTSPFIVLHHTMYHDNSYIYVLNNLYSGDLRVTINDKFLTENGRKGYDLDVINFVAPQLATVISDLHNKYRVMHCDIKPENILVDSRGYIRLCDLTHMRKIHKYRSFDEPRGTVGYMAPEILFSNESSKYKHGSEWFNFGAILFELYRGIPLIPPHVSAYDEYAITYFPQIQEFTRNPKDTRIMLSDLQWLIMLCCTPIAEVRRTLNMTSIKSSSFFLCTEWSHIYQKLIEKPKSFLVPTNLHNLSAKQFDSYIVLEKSERELFHVQGIERYQNMVNEQRVADFYRRSRLVDEIMKNRKDDLNTNTLDMSMSIDNS